MKRAPKPIGGPQWLAPDRAGYSVGAREHLAATAPEHAIRPDQLAALTYCYLLLLLVAGGGGTPAPLAELFCQVLAALALVAWTWLQGPMRLADQRTLLWVTGLVLAVPVSELLPLPPALWQSLPGRALLGESLALADAQYGWRPLSVAPLRTLQALLSLLPPLLAMLMTATLTSTQRTGLLRLIAMFAILSVMVGATQLASDESSLLQFYAGAQPGVLYGFQANRNAQADILLIGLLAALTAWQQSKHTAPVGIAILGAVTLLLLIGTALTGSRMGIALLPVALGWSLTLKRKRVKEGSTIPPSTLQIGLLLAVGGLIIAALQSRKLAGVLARFDVAREYRPDLWRDTIYAIGQYWPAGSGMGTFTRVIGPAERLEAIGPTLPNRAHNEYLELLLEGGLAGAVIWLIVAILALRATQVALRSDMADEVSPAVFAAGTLTIIMLHAAVDYPLRSMGLAGLLGVAAAFVLAPPPSGTQTT